MSIPFLKTAFVAGELAPSLWGHTDLAKFSVGASTIRNCWVNYRGGAWSRAGTAYCLNSKQPYGTPPRLIRFQFNLNQGYALEFGEQYIRFYSAGAPILEASKTIATATQTNPCGLSVLLHGYANGDWVFITGCQGMTQLNSNFYIVQNVTTNTFTLTDLYGNNINATAYGGYVPGTGSVARVYTLATPYAAADLPSLKFTQSADVMSLTHPSYPPHDLARITANHWTLTASTFSASTTAPSVLIAQATVHPSTATSPPTLPTAYAYVVTAIDAATGQESIASPIADVTDSVDISSTAGSIVLSWSAVSTAGIYNIYKAPTSYNTNPSSTTNALPVPAGAPFGYIGSSYGNQFVDSNITADFTQVPPLHSNPFAPGQITSLPVTVLGSGYTTASIAITTSAGAGLVAAPVIINGQILSWIITNGGHDYASGDTATVSGDGAGAAANVVVGPTSGINPGVVSYFQQRRVYANSTNNPDTYWMSQPGAFLNFDTSIPVTASDAITGTPWAQQVNGIQAMVPMPGGLVALTGTGAWQITGAGGSAVNPQPITPSSQQAQPQAFNGCHQHVPPITINYDILYVQSKGSIVRDLQYNYWVNIYTGSDLTELSSHLFNNYSINEWAWCEEPYKIVWAVRDDGTMLSLTYVKEQEVFGWARHDTNGQFVSVCSVTEPPVDALYLVTARCVPQTSAGTSPVYYIERMDNRVWRTAEDPWCVDCAIAYPMPQPDAILLASSSTGAVTFTATAAVFSPASVSQVIRMGGGIATIGLYTSPTVVSGTWNLPPVLTVPNDPRHYVVPAQSGQWSVTPQTQTLTGLQHLIGLTVTGLADGIKVPPTVVAADGSVTLPFVASNIKLGLPFTAQLQSVYLVGGEQPTGQGRRKDMTAVTVRVDRVVSAQIGTNQPDGSAETPIAVAPIWSGMQTLPAAGSSYAAPLTYLSPGGQTVTLPFTGDMRANVESSWQKPGQVAVQQVDPLPLQVTAFIPEVMPGDLPEQGYAPQQGGGQRSGPPAGPRPPGAWMLRG